MPKYERVFLSLEHLRFIKSHVAFLANSRKQSRHERELAAEIYPILHEVVKYAEMDELPTTPKPPKRGKR